MKKILSSKEAASLIKDESSLMVGGFLSCGAPDKVIDALVEQGTSNITLIANDTCVPGRDKGKLIQNKQIKKVITTHIGTNPDTGAQLQAGEIEVELIPMGTLFEKIRAKGAGLGGVLTPTGVNTPIEENKETMVIDGKKFIFEKPLGADVALIYGTKADKFGNLTYFGTTRNCNTVMATAAKTVIAEVEELVEKIDPNEVVVPGIFIDYIVVREQNK